MRYELITEKAVGNFDADLEMRKDYKFCHDKNASNHRQLASRTWHLYTDTSELRYVVTLKEQGESLRFGYELGVILSIKPVGENVDDLVDKMDDILDNSAMVQTGFMWDVDNTKSLQIHLSSTADDYLYMLFNTLTTHELFLFPEQLVDDIKKLKYSKIYYEKDELYYKTIDQYLAANKFEEALDYASDTFQELSKYQESTCDYLYYLGNKLSKIPGADNYAYIAYSAAQGNYLSVARRKAFMIASDLFSKAESLASQDYWIKEIATLVLIGGQEDERRVFFRILGDFCGNPELTSQVFAEQEINQETTGFLCQSPEIFSLMHPLYSLANISSKQNKIIQKLNTKLTIRENSGHAEEVNATTPLVVLENDELPDTSIFSEVASMVNSLLSLKNNDASSISQMRDPFIVEDIPGESQSLNKKEILLYELIKSVGDFNADIEIRKEYKFQDYDKNGGNYRQLASITWHLYTNTSALRYVVTLKEDTERFLFGRNDLVVMLSIKPVGEDADDLVDRMVDIIDKSSTVISNIHYYADNTPYLQVHLSSTADDYLYMFFNTLTTHELFLFPEQLINDIKQLKYSRIYHERDETYYKAVDQYLADNKFQNAIDYADTIFQELPKTEQDTCDYLYYLGNKLSKICGAEHYAYIAYSKVQGNYFLVACKEALIISGYLFGNAELSASQNYWLKEIGALLLIPGQKDERRIFFKILGVFCGNPELAAQVFAEQERNQETTNFLRQYPEIFGLMNPLFSLMHICRKQTKIIQELSAKLAARKTLSCTEYALPKTLVFSDPLRILKRSLHQQFQDLRWISQMHNNAVIGDMSRHPERYMLIPYNPPKF